MKTDFSLTFLKWFYKNKNEYQEYDFRWNKNENKRKFQLLLFGLILKFYLSENEGFVLYLNFYLLFI